MRVKFSKVIVSINNKTVTFYRFLGHETRKKRGNFKMDFPLKEIFRIPLSNHLPTLSTSHFSQKKESKCVDQQNIGGDSDQDKFTTSHSPV